MTARPRKPRPPRADASLKTLADYRASGALTPPTPVDYWLVVRPDGFQFSIHRDREDADWWADKIGGSVKPHTPTPSNYWTPGETHYDH